MSGVSKPAGSLMFSTIALKIYMALTGVLLTGFLFIHMAGHLQIFLGRDAYNTYAATLQSLGAIKWAARFGLLGATALHIASAVALTRRKYSARVDTYSAGLKRNRTTLAATIMFEGGLVVFAFILYHLAHFTLGLVHTQGGDLIDGTRHDVYSHFVISFQNPLITGVYVFACLALAAHVSHGVSSMFKTLGLAVGRFRKPIELVGPAYATLIFLGFIIVPLACFFGNVTLGGN